MKGPLLLGIACLCGLISPARAQMPAAEAGIKIEAPASGSAPEDTRARNAANIADSLYRTDPDFPRPDFTEFGIRARNDGEFFSLARRFEAADPTLGFADIATLYYGYAYRDEYSGWEPDPSLRDLENLPPKERYRACLRILERCPASLAYLNRAIALAKRIRRPQEERDRLVARHRAILECIYQLGQGTREAPFPVIFVSDEYQMMYALLGVKRVGLRQTLIGTVSYDLFSIDPVDGPLFRGEEVWFDITCINRMFHDPHYWANSIREKTKQ